MRYFLSCVVIFSFLSCSHICGQVPSPELTLIENKIKELNAKFGAKEVLLVFDIDNTLLASTTQLGSDQWFTWQDTLLENKEKSPEDDALLVSRDFGGLLAAQGVLFYMGKMRLTDQAFPKLISSFGDAGNTVIALTSRGPEYSYQTIRELFRNKYDFGRSAPPFIEGLYEPVKGFDLERLKGKFRLSKREAEQFQVSKMRSLQYLDGVFYSSGHHKGAMLRLFLAAAQISPKAIVFVDDKVKHLVRVQEAFEEINDAPHIFVSEYKGEEGEVQAFEGLDKEALNQEWKRAPYQVLLP